MKFRNQKSMGIMAMILKPMLLFTAVLTIFVLLAGIHAPAEAQGPNPRPQVWADGELFNSIVPPTAFDPTSGNFDELYTGGNGFLNGVPLISEAKPGDQDYNGGRWHKNVLKAGVDPDKYQNADSVDDLDLNDFESTDEYFECPLIPTTGGGSGN